MRETLDKMQAQVSAADKEREGSFRDVASRLGSLARTEEQLKLATDGLVKSLRSPGVRGKWGEIQLKRIVELAGLLEQCDFFQKEIATTDDGARQVPDLIVKLPGGTSIVVDAKVPIERLRRGVQRHE